MRPDQLRVMRILWASLVASTFGFVIVAFVLRTTVREVPEPMPILLPIGVVLALPLVVLSVWVPRTLLVQTLRRREFEVGERIGQERMFADRALRPRVFVDPAGARRDAVPAYQTAMILGMALAESVALFGLVLIVLGHGPLVGLPFFVVAWSLMLVRLPSHQALERALEQAYDADLEPVSGRRSDGAGKPPGTE